MLIRIGNPLRVALRERGRSGKIPGLRLLAGASLAALTVLAASTTAQEGRSGESEVMVAVYDGGGVTVEEFKTKYQKAADKYAGYDIRKYKSDILANIVLDDLLVREAEERGFVDMRGEWDPKIIEAREKMMVNQLRRSVILEDVTVTEEELRNLYERNKIRRLTRTVTVSNKEDAEMIDEKLAAGEDIIDLAKKWSLDVGSAQWDAILAWVKPGDAPIQVEKVIESLEVGEIAGPVEGSEGYFFFRVDSLHHKDDLDPYEDERAGLRTKAFKQKRTPVLEAFMDSVIEARAVEYNDEAIEMIIDRFQKEGWVEDDKPGRTSAIPRYTPEEWATPIFSFEGGTHTVHEYLRFVEESRLNPAYYLAGREEMERGLRKFVRDKLELYLAYEMDMDEVDSVRGHVRDKARQKGVIDMLVDAAGGEESARATDADRRAFYEKNTWKYTEPGAIVFSVISTRDPEVVDQLYADMKRGVPFDQLVEDYRWVIDEDHTSERMRLESKDKEDNPEIFNTARRMKVGAVSEPIPLQGRIASVIKLLEREPSRVLPYEEVEDEVRVDLNLEILNDAAAKIQEFKDGILEKYDYTVNEEVLESMQL